MVRVRHVVLAAVTVMASPAAAEVLDATYRGHDGLRQTAVYPRQNA